MGAASPGYVGRSLSRSPHSLRVTSRSRRRLRLSDGCIQSGCAIIELDGGGDRDRAGAQPRRLDGDSSPDSTRSPRVTLASHGPTVIVSRLQEPTRVVPSAPGMGRGCAVGPRGTAASGRAQRLRRTEPPRQATGVEAADCRASEPGLQPGSLPLRSFLPSPLTKLASAHSLPAPRVPGGASQ